VVESNNDDVQSRPADPKVIYVPYYEPDRVTVTAGEVVDLVFTRTVEHTCVTTVIVSLDARTRIERPLPVDVPITVTLRFAPNQRGELGFSCPMSMIGGAIDVR